MCKIGYVILIMQLPELQPLFVVSAFNDLAAEPKNRI